MSRRRTLRPDEREIWQAVARTARPLHVAPPDSPAQAIFLPEASAPPIPPQTDIAPLRGGKLGGAAKMASTAQLFPTTGAHLAGAPLRMDAKTHGKMTRGKLQPEARIDLHGMTLDQAHPALMGFIQRAHSAGLRLVLVITGKGGRAGRDTGPLPQRTGVLRRQVPHWLHQSPTAQMILQVTEAHATHGGGGALYVYLRRRA